MGTHTEGSDRSKQRTPAPQHDQDSDPPRTAVPPGSPKPGESATPKQDRQDQDSDPPRTGVRP